MDILNQLNTYTYEFRSDEFPHMNLPTTRQFGLISEEVETVLPELLKHTIHPDNIDDKGNIVNESVEFNAVNYTALIPLLIQGLKEQQQEIDQLKAEVEALRSENTQTVTLSSAARLDQNTPNPFHQSTAIRYFLPEKTANAEIRIFDMSGSVIKIIPLQQKGEGRVVIQAGELNPGTYTYTLTLDGAIVNSYKMVLTQ
jgi:hypothetical protein